MILQGKSISKFFGVKHVLDSIDIVINKGEKVGLVGINGAGKTTLLQCLAGKIPVDDGEVFIKNGCSLGYLEQFPEFLEGTTLLEYLLEMFKDIFIMRDRLRLMEKEMGLASDIKLERLLERYSALSSEYEKSGGFECEARIRKVIKGLGFSEEDLMKNINNFSGGEKTRAGLARILVREPDLLILDEPTNHLDLEALEWLESFLKNYRGAALLISHDRYFLDEIVTRIVEVKDKKATSFPGNYTKYMVLKKEQELSQRKAYEKQSKEIKKMEEYILKYKAGIKAKQARGRQSKLNRVERLADVKKEAFISFDFIEQNESGKNVLQLNDLGMSLGEKNLFNNISFSLKKGEKVALIGKNGTGKSTIFNIIGKKLQAQQGTVNLGARVKMAYFTQEHEEFNDKNRIIDEIIYQYGFSEEKARNVLASILFFGDDVFKCIADLSGGEKGRLAFLKVILEEANLLLLDEPTNYLDIASKEVIEEILQDFSGTVFLISHDRYFLDKVTNKTLELKDGKINIYLGSYSYYKEKKEELEKEKEYKKEKKLQKSAQAFNKPKINKSRVREEIEKIEEEINSLEKKIAELSIEMTKAENYQDEDKSKKMIEEYKKTEEKIPLLYQEWEEKLGILNEG